MRKAAWGWAARERWIVTGTNSKYAAIDAAVPHAAGHPDNPYIHIKARDADPIGLLAWSVTGDYSFGDVGLASDNPLLEPPRIRYEKVKQTYPVDVDLNTNAILDSAGQPLDPRETENVPMKKLIVKQARPFFDVGMSIQYEDSVCSDAFNIQGAGGLTAGQCYCDCIEPIEEYTHLAPYVWVEFAFLIAGGKNPFQAHPIDQGRTGWYTDSGGVAQRGLFCNKNKDVSPIPVRLNGVDGQPIDSGWFILGDDGGVHSPVANPTPPTGLTIETSLSGPKQKTMLWFNKTRQPFSGLI
jgi:hypothetical protein